MYLDSVLSENLKSFFREVVFPFERLTLPLNQLEGKQDPEKSSMVFESLLVAFVGS